MADAWEALDFGEFDNKRYEMDRAEREIIATMQESLLGSGSADPDSPPNSSACLAAQAWYPIGVRIRESIISGAALAHHLLL